ncbi:MAG: DUF2069 domain-containing protein [Halieaceae bacterium]|jgi:uncharacterized membrane protein|nr:DUF2069 domain-containing protein [Halieaceae bacterium]
MDRVAVARWLSLGSYLGLIAFGMAWAIFLGDVPEQRISFSLLFFAPLLLPLRGILHARDKSILWGTLISLLYVLDGGTLWWSDAIRWHLGALELLLAVTFILSGSFFIRWRAEANAGANTAS